MLLQYNKNIYTMLLCFHGNFKHLVSLFILHCTVMAVMLQVHIYWFHKTVISWRSWWSPLCIKKIYVAPFISFVS